MHLKIAIDRVHIHGIKMYICGQKAVLLKRHGFTLRTSALDAMVKYMLRSVHVSK